jgi:hypothetical protein
MTSQQPTQETTVLPTTCGCGGKIEEGVGCVQYLNSDDFDLHTSSEMMMRAGGMGFGQLVFDSADDAMMSMHLQHNGLGPKQAEAILLGDCSATVGS